MLNVATNTDSIVVVNYDSALTFFDDANCPDIMHRASFARKQTGVNEIELIVSI